eukprot:CAMPEP_0173403568 /NCGR_PEP_ID=MMETSP1356-20130122/57160_1 /TAXON_ID=77927 ORGANISM="Hemiselmis virescens, Strain PCC157" /NCGR_SAMPLE_ID=MMETSP1356 /ASSEMBLY_ACC=CAM_ASM_000847 /LENGTH=238 /DNA_ID=CAMNT_0014364117 /DNA_START=3 /DNA_END=720 /DNA_ORIENTATION=-
MCETCSEWFLTDNALREHKKACAKGKNDTLLFQKETAKRAASKKSLDANPAKRAATMFGHFASRTTSEQDVAGAAPSQEPAVASPSVSRDGAAMEKSHEAEGGSLSRAATVAVVEHPCAGWTPSGFQPGYCKYLPLPNILQLSICSIEPTCLRSTECVRRVVLIGSSCSACLELGFNTKLQRYIKLGRDDPPPSYAHNTEMSIDQLVKKLAIMQQQKVSSKLEMLNAQKMLHRKSTCL